MITIKKGDITIEVSQDCDVTVEGDLVKVSPKSVIDAEANAVASKVSDLLKLREPGTARPFAMPEEWFERQSELRNAGIIKETNQ